jgi:hypothetical protein
MIFSIFDNYTWDISSVGIDRNMESMYLLFVVMGISTG